MWVLFSALLTGRPPHEGTDPSEEAIQALVEAARSGDDGAAQRLYGLLVARVFRAVRPLCVSEAEAEDVCQETFIRVLASLPGYQRQPGVRFLSWVLTIGLNLARNRLRRRRAEPTEPATLDRMRDGAEDSPSPELADERRRQVAALLAAMESLSERDRQVVSLRYGAGLEAPEVASLLGLTAPNVRKICERSRARLLTQLGLGSDVAEEGAHP